MFTEVWHKKKILKALPSPCISFQITTPHDISHVYMHYLIQVLSLKYYCHFQEQFFFKMNKIIKICITLRSLFFFKSPQWQNYLTCSPERFLKHLVHSQSKHLLIPRNTLSSYPWVFQNSNTKSYIYHPVVDLSKPTWFKLMSDPQSLIAHTWGLQISTDQVSRRILIEWSIN